MTDYVGTSGNDPASHSTDTTAKTWDYSQGGNDTLTGGTGNDTFYMGAAYWFALDAVVQPNDVIDGGGTPAGIFSFPNNVLELAGNYNTYYAYLVQFGGGVKTVAYSAQLDITSAKLRNVQTIQLDEGSGFGYNIKLEDGTGVDTIDASALTAAPLVIDGSAVTDGISYTTGSSTFHVTGGVGNDYFFATAGIASGSRIDGGGGGNTVFLDTTDNGTTLNLPDSAFTNIQDFYFVGDHAYTVTAADSQTAAGTTLTVLLYDGGLVTGPLGSLNFDGSAERDGEFYIVGGNGSDTLIGGAGDDWLNGGSGTGSDTINGGAGNDMIQARGAGSQTISGGSGNDNIYTGGSATIDAGDGDDYLVVAIPAGATIRIDGGSGTDSVDLRLPTNQTFTIDSSVLQNIEAISLNENGVYATDRFSAIWEDGILMPGQVMPVSFGYFVGYDFDASAETNGSFVFTLETVDFGTTGNHVTGGAGADTFILDDPAYGPTGGSIYDGGGGIDTLDYSMAYGAIRVDAAAGTVFGEGSDTVGDHVSNFEIYRFGAADNSFAGSSGADTVYMLGAGEDTVHAGGGDDVLYFGATFDHGDLIDGGAGNDTLVLDGDYTASGTFSATTLTNVETLRLGGAHSYTLITNDATVAAGKVLTVDGHALGAADTLTFVGTTETDGAFALTGGAGADTLIGGAGNDVLVGGAGDDQMVGGTGADRMEGGAGDDTYAVDNARDVVVEADGQGIDTVSSSVSFNLAGQFVENLTLTGSADLTAAGNGFANHLTGNSGANRLNGGAGADVMAGGAGNDVYIVDDAGDVVTELAGQGSDRVESSVSYTLGDNVENLYLTGSALTGTGNALANLVKGNSQNNILDGGAGADDMRGGKGEDIYFVDNAGDKVVELDGEGNDTVNSSVTFSLANQYIEVLNLTGSAAINGTGNGLNNRIVGNSAANTLVGGDGNDRLDGGGGADTLKGGLGNDTYVVENAGDKITENNGDGTDTVEAWISYSLVGQYIETLKLMGSDNLGATGNGQVNALYGNAGNNLLNGMAGADTMAGGAGDDTYVVDDAGDKVIENANEGTDLVQSSVTFSLANQYIEALTLTGSAAANGTGNNQANTLTGNTAANTLNGSGGDDQLHGGLGSDTLTGGAGLDTFWFETALGASNVDTITDFKAADDTINLDRTIFSGITANGALAGTAFYQGAAAHDADDRIVYDKASGNLYYDADGTGAGAAVLFAHVAANTAMTAADFFAVA